MKKISICIPAYNRVDVLKRSLDSIFEQDFTDFEVIVTDDSPNDSVKNLVQSYPEGTINYFKNPKNLGSPENWNECVRKAQGKYIKILHHDDWFASPHSLRRFVNMLDENPNADIAFSGSCDIYPNYKKIHITDKHTRDKIKQEPEFIFHENCIGAPDVCIFKNNRDYFFDSNLIWLVDIDFFIRVLKQNSALVYTEEILVNIGISEQQISKQCQADSMLQVKEAIYLYRNLNLKNKGFSYRKTLLRLFGRAKLFTTSDLKKMFPDEKMELSASDTLWTIYFFFKKQIRALLLNIYPLKNQKS